MFLVILYNKYTKILFISLLSILLLFLLLTNSAKGVNDQGGSGGGGAMTFPECMKEYDSNAVCMELVKSEYKLLANGTLYKPTVADKYINSSAMIRVNVMNADGTVTESDKTVTKPVGALASLISGLQTMLFPSPIVGTTQTMNAQGETVEKVAYVNYGDSITTNVLTASGFMYSHPPVEPTSVWAQNTFNEIKDKVNPITEVKAQAEESTVYFPGFGYEILQPTRSFWNVTRNLSYGLLIIVVLVIVVLILFRSELNGKQVVTLMNSIPSVILSLVLITFSYPLSGLFIDLITVGANVTQSILVSTPGAPGYNTIWKGNLESGSSFAQWEAIQNTMQNNGVDNIAGQPLDAATKTIESSTAVQIDDKWMSVWSVFGTADLDLVKNNTEDGEQGTELSITPDDSVLRAAGPIQAIAGSMAFLMESNDNMQSLAGQLLSLIFGFAALTASLRVFMSLLNSYLVLIVYPIISPLLFLAAAIPSMTMKITTGFFKTMLAASLTFVAIYALYLFIVVISYEPLIQQFSFLPPLLGYEKNITVGTNLVKVLIGYGLFISAPLIPDLIKQAFEATGAEAFGKNIGDTTKSAGNTALGALQGITGLIQKKRWGDK